MSRLAAFGKLLDKAFNPAQERDQAGRFAGTGVQAFDRPAGSADAPKAPSKPKEDDEEEESARQRNARLMAERDRRAEELWRARRTPRSEPNRNLPTGLSPELDDLFRRTRGTPEQRAANRKK